MRRRPYNLICSVLLAVAVTVPGAVWSGPSIQEAIDTLPAAGGTVRVRAGTHVLTRGIHIRRSHVELIGEPGAVLKLGDDVLQPVILIGSDKAYPRPDDRIDDIRIANLELDGNMDRQRGAFPEFDPSRCTRPGKPDPETCWIRNNAIDARGVTGLRVENVDAHHARSGGLVVSWQSREIYVANSSFNENWFDGIGLYDSESVVVTGFFCNGNRHAGISLDNDLRDVTFSAGHVRRNGGTGVFARHARDIGFHGVIMAENGEHGAFLAYAKQKEEQALAQRGERLDTGVYRVVFNGCSFLDNREAGIFLAAPADRSRGNAVLGSLFSGNRKGPTSEAVRGTLLGIPTNVFTDGLSASAR